MCAILLSKLAVKNKGPCMWPIHPPWCVEDYHFANRVLMTAAPRPIQVNMYLLYLCVREKIQKKAFQQKKLIFLNLHRLPLMNG